jgi:hypothetical protein
MFGCTDPVQVRNTGQICSPICTAIASKLLFYAFNHVPQYSCCENAAFGRDLSIAQLGPDSSSTARFPAATAVVPLLPAVQFLHNCPLLPATVLERSQQ